MKKTGKGKGESGANEMSKLTTQAPDIFWRLASHYQLEPERLAAALIYQFCLKPPTEIILVSRIDGKF